MKNYMEPFSKIAEISTSSTRPSVRISNSVSLRMPRTIASSLDSFGQIG
jgi:hypothetical protein